MSGIQRRIGKEKVAYFADTAGPEEVLAWLTALDVELPENEEYGSFFVTEAAESVSIAGKRSAYSMN